MCDIFSMQTARTANITRALAGGAGAGAAAAAMDGNQQQRAKQGGGKGQKGGAVVATGDLLGQLQVRALRGLPNPATK
jgi:hypothetical protein